MSPAVARAGTAGRRPGRRRQRRRRVPGQSRAGRLRRRGARARTAPCSRNGPPRWASHQQRRRVLRADRRAARPPANSVRRRVTARMDSKLVVEQMSGRWKVKHPDMKPLASQAAALVAEFDRVDFEWVPRARERARRPARQRGDGRRQGRPDLGGGRRWRTGRPCRRRARRDGRTSTRRGGPTSPPTPRRPAGPGGRAAAPQGRRADPVRRGPARRDHLGRGGAVRRPAGRSADRARPAAGGGGGRPDPAVVPGGRADLAAAALPEHGRRRSRPRSARRSSSTSG